MSHKKSGKYRAAKSIGDVTLNDFANATVSKGRLKKSTNSVCTVLKNFEEEKSWDEKIDEFDGDFVEQVDEEGNVSFVIRKVEQRRRRKTISNSEEIKNIGNDYPIDIWFLLSEYIKPEDVGRFAGICKTAFKVVCTAKFWFSLYRRYYKNVPNVPDELQPECLVRKYSLRPSVIRALYYTYPPFVNRLKSIKTAVEEHPDTLIWRQCDSLWWQRKKCGRWLFYLKLREMRNYLLHHSRRTDYEQPDLLQILDDISANPDENCSVLQVTCKHFIQIQPVIGQVLTSVCLTLSQGFRHHRLQLGFGSGIKGYRSPDGSTHTNIVLDPVINFRVLDWWHPLYPHNSNIQDLLNQE